MAVSATAGFVARKSGLEYMVGIGAETCFRSAGVSTVALLEGIWHRSGRRPAGASDERLYSHDWFNQAPQRALSTGGILRWKDGRNMPDVHATIFEFNGIPVYMRINLGTETSEGYRFMGSKGILDVTHTSITFTHRQGLIPARVGTQTVFRKVCARLTSSKWHAEHDVPMEKAPITETVSYQRSVV